MSVLVLAGCSGPSPVAAKPSEPAAVPELEAETLVIEQMSWPTIVRCQGTLSADETAAVGTRVAGRVAEVHVKLGEAVKADEPLVTLQSDEFELLVAQAEAQLAQARSAVGIGVDELVDSLDPENSPPVRQQRAIWNETKASLQRAESLRQQNALSQGEFDLAAAAERVAEASYAAAVNGVREQLSIIGIRRVELELARQRLKDAVIRAPFDGLVQNSRMIAPGTYISAGDTVVSLVRTDPIWFRGKLPERYASQLETGLAITVRVGSTSDPIEATVTRISPSLNASQFLEFEARIENPLQGLRSGLFAQADVVLDSEAQSLIVPVSAISDFAGSEKVWKLIDGVAQQLEIVTGMRRDGFVEILGGLTGGDRILCDAAIGRVARVVTRRGPASIAGPPSASDGQDADESPAEGEAVSVSRPQVGESLARPASAGEISSDNISSGNISSGNISSGNAAGATAVEGPNKADKKLADTLAGVSASVP